MKNLLHDTNYNLFEDITLLKSYWQKIKNLQFSNLVAPLILRFPIPAINILSWLAIQNTYPYFYFQTRNRLHELAGVGYYPNHSKQSISLNDWQELCLKHPQKEFLRFFFSRNFSTQETWGEFSLLKHFLPNIYCERIDQEYFINYLIPINSIKDSKDIDNLVLKLAKSLSTVEDGESREIYNLPTIISRADLPDKKKWQENIVKILDSIESGKVNKVVSARRSNFKLSNSLSALLLLDKLKKIKQSVYHFVYAPKEGQAFLGASPERLFKLSQNKIVTEALAGTCSSNANSVEESLYTEKNLREHELVVSGLIKRLETLTSSNIKRAPVSTMTLSEVHHLYSRIEVTCQTLPDLDTIISALHPTASVCGTPKEEAFNLINSLEGFSRGLYAGPLGIATADSIECIVALRSCLLQNDSLSIFAGAGIVEGSDPDEEWQELETKIATILKLF